MLKCGYYSDTGRVLLQIEITKNKEIYVSVLVNFLFPFAKYCKGDFFSPKLTVQF